MGYGVTVVCGDYKGNLQKIVKVLNGLDFDPEDTRFEVIDKSIVAESCGEYPGADPFRWALKFSDGRKIYRKEATEALIEEWERDAGGDDDREEVGLDC